MSDEVTDWCEDSASRLAYSRILPVELRERKEDETPPSSNYGGRRDLDSVRSNWRKMALCLMRPFIIVM